MKVCLVILVDGGCGGHLKLMLVKVDKHCSTLVIHCEVSLSIWKARVIGLPEVESLNISVKESGFVLDASGKESGDALDASVKHLYWSQRAGDLLCALQKVKISNGKRCKCGGKFVNTKYLLIFWVLTYPLPKTHIFSSEWFLCVFSDCGVYPRVHVQIIAHIVWVYNPNNSLCPECPNSPGCPLCLIFSTVLPWCESFKSGRKIYIVW